MCGRSAGAQGIAKEQQLAAAGAGSLRRLGKAGRRAATLRPAPRNVQRDESAQPPGAKRRVEQQGHREQRRDGAQRDERAPVPVGRQWPSIVPHGGEHAHERCDQPGNHR